MVGLEAGLDWSLKVWLENINGEEWYTCLGVFVGIILLEWV